MVDQAHSQRDSDRGRVIERVRVSERASELELGREITIFKYTVP